MTPPVLAAAANEPLRVGAAILEATATLYVAGTVERSAFTGGTLGGVNHDLLGGQAVAATGGFVDDQIGGPADDTGGDFATATAGDLT